MSESPVQNSPTQIDANTFIEVLENGYAIDYAASKHKIAELICQVQQYQKMLTEAQQRITELEQGKS